MPIQPSEARRLCTESEFQLYTVSQPKEIKQLTPSVLKRKISRTRRLRDKWRDLAGRQRREARGKQAPRGSRAATDNRRTERKAELFAETLARFEERLQQVEAEAAAAPAKQVRQTGIKKKAAKKKASGKATASPKKKTSRKKAAKKKG